MKTCKNLIVTCGIVLAIALFFGLVRLLALIPLGVILGLLKSNWIGLLAGVILSHLAMLMTAFLGKRKRKRKEEDDE